MRVERRAARERLVPCRAESPATQARGGKAPGVARPSPARSNPITKSVAGLPLKLGDTGPSIVDLHRRLAQAGFGAVDPREATFSAETEAAIREFQGSRRIEVDGVVGRHTWSALAEAAYRLGDRLLYHKSSPMLRGDDVAELQQRLGALGFDAGRVDGIFGPDTAKALETFQRNAGLPTDGIFGPDSLAALQRLGGRETQANVATVRERERLLQPREPAWAGRMVLGELGGLGAIVDTCARRLRHAGVQVDVLSHPDESHQARTSNGLGVDLYVAMVAADDQRCSVSYFATDGFESTGGARLAALLTAELTAAGFAHTETLGQRLPILRETRMPAVVLRLGPTSELVRSAPTMAAAVTAAVEAWFQQPVDASSDG